MLEGKLIVILVIAGLYLPIRPVRGMGSLTVWRVDINMPNRLCKTVYVLAVRSEILREFREWLKGGGQNRQAELSVFITPCEDSA